MTTSLREKTEYYDPKKINSRWEFSRSFAKLLHEYDASERDVIIVCVGSDRATGDCLGPLVGEKLSRSYRQYTVYGTLDNPVHARNLAETISTINAAYYNPLIIAIDASLGISRHVGYVTMGKGCLRPGIGVGKDLQAIGDIYITGIVGISGMLNQMLLQTTRLSLVMHLADFIYTGIRQSRHHLR